MYKETRKLLPLDGNEAIMEGTEPIGKTKDGWIAVKPEPRPWLIERPLRHDGDCLTISEDGSKNRQWKQDEILKIQDLFNASTVVEEKIK